MKTNRILCVAALLFSFAAVAAKPAFDTLISHRGESIDAPENTLPAYKTAVERGFGFECDIYLSKDGYVFTFHDRTLTRTSGDAQPSLLNVFSKLMCKVLQDGTWWPKVWQKWSTFGRLDSVLCQKVKEFLYFWHFWGLIFGRNSCYNTRHWQKVR